MVCKLKNEGSTINPMYVNMLWKHHDGFYYIEYSTSSGTKRGYVPASAVTPPSGYYFTDQPYPEWGSNCGAVNVYNLPGGGTFIGATNSNIYVIVLGEEKIGNTWYCYIQYELNGYKRGWVLKSAVNARGTTQGINSGQKYYIKSSYNKYLDLNVSNADINQWTYNGVAELIKNG